MFPIRRVHFGERRVVECFPVRAVDAIRLEAKQLAGQLDQPTKLHGVVDLTESLRNAVNLFFGADARLFDVFARHAGRVGEFGIIVIAEDVSQRFAGWTVRIDMCVRVDEN